MTLLQVKLCGNLTNDKEFTIAPNAENRFNLEFTANTNTNFKGFRWISSKISIARLHNITQLIKDGGVCSSPDNNNNHYHNNNSNYDNDNHHHHNNNHNNNNNNINNDNNNNYKFT